MGDTSIAEDILDAVSDTMADDVGKELIVREIVEGAIDSTNAGAGRTKTGIDHTTNGIISAYDASKVDGTVVQSGDMEGILSIKELSITIEPGMRLIDGDLDYEIVSVDIPEVAGIDVVATVQLRR